MSTLVVFQRDVFSAVHRAVACGVSVAAFLAFLLVSPPRSAPGADAPRPNAAAPGSAAAPVDIDDLPVAAPNVGGITKRTTAGARGGPRLGIFLFAPQGAGATAREHPTFYWYLTQLVEDDSELVVSALASHKPGEKPADPAVVARKKFSGAQPPGIYAATLDDKALEPDKMYQVSVVVHRSGDNDTFQDVSSAGYLVYRPAQKGVASSDDAKACAEAGLWYDAIDATLRAIEKNPSETKPHRQLHGLLWREHVLYNDPGSNALPEQTKAAKQEEEDHLKHLDASHDAVVKAEPDGKAK